MKTSELAAILLIGMGSSFCLFLILRDIARHPRRWLDDAYWRGRIRRRRGISPMSRGFSTGFGEPFAAPGSSFGGGRAKPSRAGAPAVGGRLLPTLPGGSRE